MYLHVIQDAAFVASLEDPRLILSLSSSIVALQSGFDLSLTSRIAERLDSPKFTYKKSPPST